MSLQTLAQQANLPLNPTTSTPWVNGSSPSFTVTQTNSSTGLSSWAPLIGPSTAPRVIDSDLTNAAQGTIAVTGSLTLNVADADQTYSAGNFAGFLIKNTSVVGVTLLNSTTIKTYLNGTLQETSTASSILGITSSLITGASEVGIYTTKPYNEVEITLTNPLTLVTTYEVFYAVQRAYTAGPALVCNAPTALNYPAFPAVVNNTNTGTTGLGTLTTPENAVDATTTNSAGLSVIGIGSSFLSVKDQVTNYPAKTFAGFDIENTTVLNLGVFNNLTLTTYLDGAVQETKTASNGLLSVGLLSGSGKQRVGFVSTLPFDEIQITVSTALSVDLGSTLVYNAVFQTFCDGTELTCNTPTALTSPSYPVIISTPNTGITGAACVNCQVTNTGNLIDADPLNHTDIVLTAGLGVSGSIAVKSVEQSYPAGTFAGFDINSPSIIGVGVLSGLRIETYLNGVATGDVFGNGSLLNASAPLLSGSGRQVIGFLATQEFDEIKLTVQQTVGITLGTTEVYGVVFTRFCAGTDLACNTLTPVTNPAFPVYVNGKNTGITSVACVACTINNSDYAIDNDPATAATIVMAVGAASSGSFAVANAVDTYAATSFAGFDVETATLLSAGVLSTATISLYNNGSLVQIGTGNALIIGASTSLLTGTSRQIVGLVATAAYDEVKITFDQVAGANLGNIKIYGAIFDKLCQGTIACNNSYFLTQPSFPVVINAPRTGISGVACVGCAVQDPWNVISSSNADFSRITLTANVGASAAIAVVDPISTYPAGTAAGFVIRNVNSIAQVDLLNSITIETYNNGVLQESRAGATLLNLELLNIITIGTGTPINPSFITTKPFDEIRIVATSLASVINTIDVFGAFVDTRSVVGGGALSCNAVKNPDFNATQINVPVPGNVSTNDVVPAGTTYGPTATAGGSNPAGGTLVLNPDGTYTFTGTSVGVYTYEIPVCIPETPCVSVPLVITVTDPTKLNNPPVANTDIASIKGAAANPGSVTINVKANDGPGNKGGTLGDPTPTSPAHGAVSVVNGNIVYTPAAGYYGEDSFTYSICETPSTLCATTTVYITVKQPDAANSTSAADDYLSTPVGIATSGNVSTNDTDPEGNTQSVAPQSITDSKGTFTLLSDGSFTFEPATGFSGPIDFAYTTCDNGTPSACASATLHLFVSPVPDLVVILTVRPGNVTGTTNITLVGDVYNVPVSSTSTNGSIITVYVAKNSLINLTLNSAATLVGGKTVQNSIWTFDGNSNPSFYILKTNAVIGDSDLRSFGLEGTITPGSSSGKLNLTAFIDSGSGGEVNDLDNSDSESILFYKNQ
ncbi:Ig-like domain-containing protein [Dyadobacter sp. LHD-138]|uniref:beta strand repeat-containing protein n=1 Tax=Dyadobacter sp. LHD-138 TaxID=3071413 RepID=UPI0027E1053C|nr:Ig-like domain-containing protein [Dyadobacter sp. LHD-138]MDQ6479000.1 Ig-like domain-containing protein [Dyadobacter sp. LHD-138]